MGALILPQRFAAQPQGPTALDRSNPIAKGCVFAWNPSVPERNIAAGTRFAGDLTAAAWAYKFGPKGKAFFAASALQGRYWTDIEIGSTFTVAAYARWDGTAATQAMVATDDTNGPFRLRGTSSPNMAFDVANTTPTIFTPVGPQVLVANQIALFAGTMDAAQNARVWIDGKPGSATAVTGTPKTLTLGNRLVITTNSAGNVRWGGDLYAAFVWNRALSQGELVSLSQAPFQLFKAPTRKLFYVGATSILPNITSVSTATPRDGATLTITGTDFGASQGAGDVKINGVTQTVTSWSDTSIDVTVVLGTNKFGAAYNVILTDSSAVPSNTYAGITGLLPANSGLSYVDLGTPNATAAYRLTASADLASGDQIEWDNKGGLVTVATDGTFTAGPGVSSFSFRVWTSGSGYGPSATQLTALGGGATDRPIIRPFNKRSGLGF